jgi:hypothetical protein
MTPCVRRLQNLRIVMRGEGVPGDCYRMKSRTRMLFSQFRRFEMLSVYIECSSTSAELGCDHVGTITINAEALQASGQCPNIGFCF